LETRYRVFTAEQALGLMRALEASIKGPLDRYVTDETQRRMVLTDIARSFAELTARRQTAQMAADRRSP
jgi:hypothetical protein